MINVFRRGIQILSEGFYQHEQLYVNAENECQVINCGAINSQLLAKVKRSKADSATVANGEKKDTIRALQNGINLKQSKQNRRTIRCDRRLNTDRRSCIDSNYTGVSRRYTIDRRANTKDRRDMD